MKKLVSLLLLFVMLMTMATFSATAEDPIEIIVARSSYPTGWPDSLDKDFIYQQILEKTGVSFKLVALDDYSQTLNLRIINDNAPDMFVINADTMRTYAAQDMLKDLTPYKNNELQCVFDTFGAGTDVPGLYYNDKMYLIPAANYDNITFQFIKFAKVNVTQEINSGNNTLCILSRDTGLAAALSTDCQVEALIAHVS